MGYALRNCFPLCVFGHILAENDCGNEAAMLVIIALLVMRVVVVVTMLAGWPGAETGGTLFELR